MSNKSFTNENLKNIRTDVDLALKEIEKKYGISLKMGNITYNHNSFRGKLEGNILTESENGVTVSKELEKVLRAFNLKANSNDGRVLVDFKPRNYKMPFIYSYKGKMYKCSEETAKKYFSI